MQSLSAGALLPLQRLLYQSPAVVRVAAEAMVPVAADIRVVARLMATVVVTSGAVAAVVAAAAVPTAAVAVAAKRRTTTLRTTRGEEEEPEEPEEKGSTDGEDYFDLACDDSDDDSTAVTSYRCPFTASAVRRFCLNRPVIHGLLLPPLLSGTQLRPASNILTGGTHYVSLAGRLHDKAAAELDFTYNISVWLQALHNRALGAEWHAEDHGATSFGFDVDTRVYLHQLFVLKCACNKVLENAVTDATQKATLHALVTRHNRPDLCCPALEFLATAQDECLVHEAARQHGRLAASEIRGEGGGVGAGSGEGGISSAGGSRRGGGVCGNCSRGPTHKHRKNQMPRSIRWE